MNETENKSIFRETIFETKNTNMYNLSQTKRATHVGTRSVGNPTSEREKRPILRETAVINYTVPQN